MASLVTMDEASEQLGRTRRCLEYWRSSGCPGFSKDMDTVFIDLEAVLGWAKETGRKVKQAKKSAPPCAPVRPLARKIEDAGDFSHDLPGCPGDLSYEPFCIHELELPYQIHFRATERIVWFFRDSVAEKLAGKSQEEIREILSREAISAVNHFYDDMVERENFVIPGIEPILQALDQITIKTE